MSDKDLNTKISHLTSLLLQKEKELLKLREALTGILGYMEVASCSGPKVAESLSMVTCKELYLIPEQRQITKGNKVVNLTAREFKIFEYLHRNSNKPCTRSEIMGQFDEPDMTARNVDVHIFALRKKLDNVQVNIETVWGEGYKMASKG